jgi:hypothetical protein
MLVEAATIGVGTNLARTVAVPSVLFLATTRS